MQQELSGVFLLLMVVALVVLGFVLRRLSKEGGGKPTAKTKHIQSGRPVPNENPARGAVKKAAGGAGIRRRQRSSPDDARAYDCARRRCFSRSVHPARLQD